MQFTKEFFKREIREGFEISEMMKRAWAAEMEVLQVVADICERNGIQYFADWGTLLGAVRHHGFIPWDDDIDICLKREDYNRLLRVLPHELPHGFVVAGMYAETERLQQAAYVQQLRVIADETLWDFYDYMQYFHGFPYQRIGIDIFPLDYLPREPELAKIQKIIVNQGIVLLDNWDFFEKKGELENQLNELEYLCNVKIEKGTDIKNRIWKLMDTICSLYRSEEADYMGNYLFLMEIDHYKLKKEWYDESIMLPFENMQIAVPAKYHEVLTAQFGDYMVPVRGTGDHTYPFYGHMEAELKKQIRAIGFEGSVEEFCQMAESGKLKG